MAVLHRALVTWFLLLILLVLLVLRLDGRTQWSWIIVLVPMWLFDVLLLVYTAVVLVWQCRAARAPLPAVGGVVARALFVWHHSRPHLATLAIVALKVAFQVCLCVHLQAVDSGDKSSQLPLYVVLAPLIALLFGFAVVLTRHLYRQAIWAGDQAAEAVGEAGGCSVARVEVDLAGATSSSPHVMCLSHRARRQAASS